MPGLPHYTRAGRLECRYRFQAPIRVTIKKEHSHNSPSLANRPRSDTVSGSAHRSAPRLPVDSKGVRKCAE